MKFNCNSTVAADSRLRHVLLFVSMNQLRFMRRGSTGIIFDTRSLGSTPFCEKGTKQTENIM